MCQGAGALDPKGRGLKALVETEGRALVEVEEKTFVGIEMIVHEGIDGVIEVDTGVDRQAQTTETAVRATTGERTIKSPSDPGVTTKGGGVLGIQEIEAQADGEDRTYHLPGHEIRPERRTKVIGRNSARLRS